MALDNLRKTQFVNGYTRALITAWSDEEFSGRLVRDPVPALREVGLELPAKARVTLVRDVPQGDREPDLDKQTALYEEGLASGHFVLYVPETPMIDMAELSEGELDGVAAGTEYCCCCSCPGCSSAIL
jgi:hypothetical protein